MSVFEVPNAGDQQRDAVLVAALHGIRVAHAAAGVDDGSHPRLARNLDRVVPSKGEERV